MKEATFTQRIQLVDRATRTPYGPSMTISVTADAGFPTSPDAFSSMLGYFVGDRLAPNASVSIDSKIDPWPMPKEWSSTSATSRKCDACERSAKEGHKCADHQDPDAPPSDAKDGTPCDVWLVVGSQNLRAFRTQHEAQSAWETFTPSMRREYFVSGPYNPGRSPDYAPALREMLDDWRTQMRVNENALVPANAQFREALNTGANLALQQCIDDVEEILGADTTQKRETAPDYAQCCPPAKLVEAAQALLGVVQANRLMLGEYMGVRYLGDVEDRARKAIDAYTIGGDHDHAGQKRSDGQ